MADRVYPSTKPPTTTTTPAAAKPPPPPSFPAPKSQLYNASRPTTYRPQQRQNHHRPSTRRTSRCCCCLCFLITLLFIILIVAVAGSVFYFLYTPHLPTFTTTTFKISQFNLTSSSTLLTKFNLTITSSNPNSKIKLLYNPISIAVSSSSHDILLGTATVPAFVHAAKNTTTFRTHIVNTAELDPESNTKLKADMKSKNGVKLKVEMNTNVKVQIGRIKSYKIPIRVLCNGIKAALPAAKTPVTTATIADRKCKVDLRIKILRWTF